MGPKWSRAAALALASPMITACAIHYYDPETQTEHVWGFGHMAMRVTPPNEGVRAVVRGVDTLGVAAGSTPHHGYLSAGWQSVRVVEVIDENTALRLEWPSADVFNLRIGTQPPRLDESSTAEEQKEPTP